MTDYHPLIAQAVEGLERNTGEARRALYERARTALVTQLRSVEPALSESDITKERLALEEAIRKVEAASARKSRTEPQRSAAPPARSAAGAPNPPASAGPARRERSTSFSGKVSRPGRAEARRPESGEVEASGRTAAPTARERLLSGRVPTLTQEGVKGFRDVVSEVHDLGAATAKAAQSARDTRDSYGSYGPVDETGAPPHGRFEPQQLDAEEWRLGRDDPQRLRSLEPSYDADDEQTVMPQSTRPQPPRTMAPEDHEQSRPIRSYRGLAQLLAVLIILAGSAATISWQWSNITGLYHTLARIRSKPPSQATQTQAPAQPKFPGRVPQEQNAGQVPAAGTPGNETAPAVAQRVVLYEEDPNDPQGKRYVGSAIWRTETVSPGAGLAPELAVRADVEIPERRMTVTWSLRRNTDKSLPASHTIEIMFKLPPDFPDGGIANIPGILMKQSEQARGTPLAGLAVKVTNGYFLIGLSAVETDVQRNVQLLKERPWFDIPIVYANGGRAILAMEKGPPGDRAFAEAFAAWEKK